MFFVDYQFSFLNKVFQTISLPMQDQITKIKTQIETDLKSTAKD